MQALPGFRDFYPEECSFRRLIIESWRQWAQRYGFVEYDGPPLEPLELYVKKSGEELVGQLYHFKDKGEREVALRAEMTPTLARMVAARHRDFRKPLKWFSIPQVFRYERQQKGRLREHFQFAGERRVVLRRHPHQRLPALGVDVVGPLFCGGRVGPKATAHFCGLVLVSGNAPAGMRNHPMG